MLRLIKGLLFQVYRITDWMVRARATSYTQPQEQCNLLRENKLMPHDRRVLLHNKNVDLPRVSTCCATLSEFSQYLQLNLLQVVNYSSVASKSFSLLYYIKLDPGIGMFQCVHSEDAWLLRYLDVYGNTAGERIIRIWHWNIEHTELL